MTEVPGEPANVRGVTELVVVVVEVPVVDVPVVDVPVVEVDDVLEAEVVDVELEPVVEAAVATPPSTGTAPPHPTVSQAPTMRPPRVRPTDNRAIARIQSPFS
jgi:hypothetical protein